MKKLKVSLSVLNLILSGYFLFLALNSEFFFSILRMIAAVIWLFISRMVYKTREVTPTQQVENWVMKEKPKGFLRFVVLNGVIGWGLPVGYSLWVSSTQLEATNHLLISFSKFIAIYLVLGFIMGWFWWNKYMKKSEAMRKENSQNYIKT
ncbi:hypothetical protein D1B31_01000 [Neobacillus notoginsengisoli]|uniref:Uncharacterized protein n=1 Tax=Neobacillus notoginsengisoli TaxID=1578198 RepID=A0A417Z025_9BACI|nr:hypothetical protein [Neobacillus notoginsengisoli]RHW43281.1 hypothetical protein D1B31_01000 [Neobacillus notoginsengisoli]